MRLAEFDVRISPDAPTFNAPSLGENAIPPPHLRAYVGSDLDVIPSNTFQLLVVDPPWTFSTWSQVRQTRAASRHYVTQPLDDIKALDVTRIATANAILFLWSTAPLQPQAFAVMKSWRFAYRSQIIWRKTFKSRKPAMGTGHWARSMHEIILIGTRGQPKAMRLPSCFDGVRREHSRKPAEFYRLIDDRLDAMGLGFMTRIDVFARERRARWAAFGDEVGRFS